MHAAQYPVCKSGPLRSRFISVMIPRSDLLHVKRKRRVRKNIVNDFPFSCYKYSGARVKWDMKDRAWTILQFGAIRRLGWPLRWPEKNTTMTGVLAGRHAVHTRTHVCKRTHAEADKHTVCTHSVADKGSTQTLQAKCWLSDGSNGQILCTARSVECVLTTSGAAVRVAVGRRCMAAAVHGGLCVWGSGGSWGPLVCIVGPRLLSTKTEMKRDDKNGY